MSDAGRQAVTATTRFDRRSPQEQPRQGRCGTYGFWLHSETVPDARRRDHIPSQTLLPFRALSFGRDLRRPARSPAQHHSIVDTSRFAFYAPLLQQGFRHVLKRRD